jgi:DNA-binding NtrC family response regulator
VTVLVGRRILIVEDEFFIALMLEDILHELGCVVVGIAARPEEALALIDTYRGAIDAAALDVNLGNATSHSIAAALDARGIPCLITTGYSDAPHLLGLEHYPKVEKPYQRAQIERGLRQLDWREQTIPLPPG